MSGTKPRKGLRHEELRERLGVLGAKARQDPHSLTLLDLDEICTLVVKLGPTVAILPDLPVGSSPAFYAPFEPLATDAPHVETQAMLRQMHAMEYIAFQLGELVRLKEEEAIRERWKTSHT